MKSRPSRRGLSAGVGARGSRTEPLQAPSPWIASHVTWCATLAAIGVLGQIACWYGVSGQATLRDQTPWVGGAVLCAAVSLGAGSAWLGVGFVVLRRARREVFAATRVLFGIPDSAARLTPVADTTAAHPDSGLVTSPVMTMVHRPGCLAARGKDVQPISADEVARAGLTNCGICAP